jgi:hypothetical protein
MHSLGTQGEGERPAHRGGAIGMNMTALIAQWSMSGARRDADGRFRVIAMRGADGSWQPLRKEEKKKR